VNGPLRAAALLFFALLSSLWSSHALSYDAPAFDVGRLRDPTALAAHVSVLHDPDGKLGLTDVRTPAIAARFQKAPEHLTFGFTTSALWMKVQAVNPRPREERWLLEAAYPALDYVTLYVVHEDGRVDQHRTGDMLPFPVGTWQPRPSPSSCATPRTRR